MNVKQIILKGLAFFSSGWKIVQRTLGSFFYKFRFLFIWFLLALLAMALTAWGTYWYKSIYEPKEELRRNPPITVDQIMESLDVNLGDFDMPFTLVGILNDAYLFSLTPEKAWNEELLSQMWIPSQEMGLGEIIQQSNETMKRLVQSLP